MKKNCLIIIVILLSVFVTTLTAQPEDLWVRTYDSGVDDRFIDVFALNGGGYVACGYSVNSNNIYDASCEFFVVRVDDDGEQIWGNNYGQEEVADHGYSVIEADNGDILVAGFTNNRQDAAVVRLNENGEELWWRTYETGIIWGIIELKSGNFVLAGETAPRGRGLMMEIDTDGEVVWRETYLPIGDRGNFEALRETDSGIVTSGYLYGAGRRQFWTQKVDHENEGDLIWSRLHYADTTNYCYDMTATGDGGFFLVGTSGGLLHGENNTSRYVHILEVDNEGRFNLENRFIFGNINAIKRAYGVSKMDNSEYMVVGSFQLGFQNGGYRPFALRTDSEGNELWRRSYAWDEDEIFGSSANFKSVVRGNDDCAVACGTIINRQDGNNDGVLVKIEPAQLEPVLFYWSPEDTVLSVFPGDTTEFIVRARDQQGDELSYEWLSADTSLGEDTTITVIWEELGEHSVQCQASDRENISAINWRVEVAELYIDSYSPDWLNLIVRPNTTVDFTVTSQATEGDPVEYAWLLNDEQIGDEDSLSITFEQVGDYEVIAVAFREEQSDSIAWWVEVKEMYIDGYSPDSLNVTVMRDRSVEFSVSVDAFEIDSVEYQWLLDDEEIDSVFNDTLLITFENSGDYQLKAITFTGDGRDSIEWRVTVVNMIINYWPHDFDLSVNIDTVIEFSIEPFNPDDPSLNIVWTLDGDSIDSRSWTFIDFDTAGEYQIEVHISDSSSADSMSWNVMVSPNDVSQNELALLPKVLTLYPPSPNPFNSQTSVRYALPVAGQVRLELFDVSGRLVSELVDQRQTAGWHDVVVDGSELVSGVYFVRMVTEKEFYTQKLLLLK